MIQQWNVILLPLLLYLPVYADTGVDNLSLSKPIAVNAKVFSGCSLGRGASDVSQFGTINFGTLSSLENNIDVVSTENLGSIIIKCNPNTHVNIALNSGSHVSGSINSGRKLKNAITNETLLYQLFQNSGFSTIWGNGSNGGSTLAITTNGSVQEYPVYARLFSNSILPSAGTYSDTVTVTINY